MNNLINNNGNLIPNKDDNQEPKKSYTLPEIENEILSLNERNLQNLANLCKALEIMNARTRAMAEMAKKLGLGQPKPVTFRRLTLTIEEVQQS